MHQSGQRSCFLSTLTNACVIYSIAATISQLVTTSTSIKIFDNSFNNECNERLCIYSFIENVKKYSFIKVNLKCTYCRVAKSQGTLIFNFAACIRIADVL